MLRCGSRSWVRWKVPTLEEGGEGAASLMCTRCTCSVPNPSSCRFWALWTFSYSTSWTLPYLASVTYHIECSVKSCKISDLV